MKIFVLLIGLALSNPTRGRYKRTCTAMCTGELDEWTSYLDNGVQTRGKAPIIFRFRTSG